MGKLEPDSHRLCKYLLVKDGTPTCFFRVADAQSCSYLIISKCYYRGGPFGPQMPAHPEETPHKDKK